MTSYVTSRDGQKITARKIREALEAIPAPEPKIRLALRLLSDAYRYGVLDAFPSGEGSPYAGYVTSFLGYTPAALRLITRASGSISARTRSSRTLCSGWQTTLWTINYAAGGRPRL